MDDAVVFGGEFLVGDLYERLTDKQGKVIKQIQGEVHDVQNQLHTEGMMIDRVDQNLK